MVGGAALLVGCTGSPDTKAPEVLPVDPKVPTPTASADSSLSTTFALITDYGTCDEGERQVADMVASWSPRIVATAGNNTDGGVNCTPYTQSVGDYYAGYLGGSDGAHFFPVPGNQDVANASTGDDEYSKFFGFLILMSDADPRWYKVNNGNVNLFMLDSEVPADALDAQKEWLQQQLSHARTEEPGFWNVVVLNHPPFTSGPDQPNTAMRPEAGWDYKGWGANVVVSGRQKVWEELNVDGLPYIVAGVGATGTGQECPSTLVPESKGCIAGTGAVLVNGFTDKLTLEYRTPDGGAGATKATVTVKR